MNPTTLETGTIDPCLRSFRGGPREEYKRALGAMIPARMKLADAVRAGKEWGFNCGPGALCGVLNLTPDEVRPHLGKFETRKYPYMNPTDVQEALTRLGYSWQRTFRTTEPAPWPKIRRGLVRIQWGGRWTKPGVPMAVRYHYTHWIGVAEIEEGVDPMWTPMFDINAISVGGWVPRHVWEGTTVPWLMEDTKGWDGSFWPTHVYEVTPAKTEVAA
jgi:hypothetical protein